MMDRSVLRYTQLVAVVMLLLLVVPMAGCTSALATALWVIRGNNVDAEYDGLRDKTVAVACYPLVELKYRNSGVAKHIARQIGVLLERNVRKIKVVDHRKVAEWVDEHGLEEYTEIGEALEADMVVGVDLEQFDIYQDQTIYQGTANVTIKVFDCHTDELVFEKILPQVVYPPNTGIPATDKQERQFRREFVSVVADQIARHFYPHDAHADFAQDTLLLD